MAGHGPVVGFGGPLAKSRSCQRSGRGRHLSVTARASLGAPAAQIARQLLTQLASGLHEQRLIDRFVRHPHLRPVRKLARAVSAAICGGDQRCSQPGDHELTQLARDRQLGQLGSPTHLARTALADTRQIALAATVARHFAATPLKSASSTGDRSPPATHPPLTRHGSPPAPPSTSNEQLDNATQPAFDERSPSLAPAAASHLARASPAPSDDFPVPATSSRGPVAAGTRRRRRQHRHRSGHQLVAGARQLGDRNGRT